MRCRSSGPEGDEGGPGSLTERGHPGKQNLVDERVVVVKKDAWVSEFREFAEKIREEHDVPGLSVAVADADQILYAEGFGLRDVERKLPATPETMYGMASVTKSFTALAIMILEAEGRLSSADPVVRYLPEFCLTGDAAGDAVTIHHFMTHTSALPPTGALRYSMVRSMEGDPSVEEIKRLGRWEQWTDRDPIDTYPELLHYIAQDEQPPLGRPGGQFSYSNDAYSLLGAIVERVSGRSFASFVRERILEPAGMGSSTMDLDFLEECSDVTQLYSKNERCGVFAAPKWQHAPAMLGAGFLRSRVTDMVRYGQAYLRSLSRGEGGVMDRGITTRMSSPYYPCTRSQYYGYGLVVRPGYRGVTLVEHGGSLKGVSSHFGYVPERNLTASVVANLQGIPASKLWLGAINLLLGLPVDARRSCEPEYEASPEELARFVGSYGSGEGASIDVLSGDGELWALVDGVRHSLRPSGPDTVAMMRRGEEAMVRFIPGPTGEVTAMYSGLRIIRRISDQPET